MKKYFYKVDGAMNVQTSATMYSEYFKQEGFIRIADESKIIIHKQDENGEFKPFNWKTDTIAYLSNKVKHSEPFMVQYIRNIVAAEFTKMKQGFLLLEATEI